MKTRAPCGKSRAICYDCGCVVQTTYAMRDVQIDSSLTVNCLACVCDECDMVVATTPEATETIREAKKVLPELCYEPFEISDEVLAELRRRYAPKNPDATTEWL